MLDEIRHHSPLLCCSAVRGEKMWLAQIFARCTVLLQFRHTTSADTLQSFTECTELPQRLHFPWKNASASSFFGEVLFGRWFLAWLLFCAFWVFRFTAYAFFSNPADPRSHREVYRAQRLINLEIPVLVRSLKSSNVELG